MLRKLLRSLSSVVGTGHAVQRFNVDFLKPLTALDLANIRLALSSTRPTSSSPPCGFPVQAQAKRNAAVLVALCNLPGEGTGVILTVRSRSMRTHPGEISLPGGHQDLDTDQSLLSTALRETYEEVGLIPAQAEYLGSLLPTVSNSGATLVWPYVVFIHSLENTPTPSFPDAGPGPMIPRLITKQGNSPLKSLKLQEFQGKHQVDEVDVVLQMPFITLLNTERQIHSYFRNDSQRPYLEWWVKPEVLSARGIINRNGESTTSSNHEGQDHQVTKGAESFKLWGLSGWIIHSFLQKIRAW